MENRTGASAPPTEESVDRAKGAVDTALSDVKQVARDAASTVKSAVKEEADAAKEKANAVLGDVQAKAADQARTAANTLRDTAERLDGELPWMKTALDKTADGLERLTSTINTGDMKQTVNALTQFARNHPALFLGLSVAAGFAVARVGKTAMEGAHGSDMRDAGQGLVDEAVAPYAPVSGV
jgi:ElaB/YqjD/DUF883 family membrane-anchored ribosome-binding protein